MRKLPGFLYKTLDCYYYVTCALHSRCTHPLHIGCFQLSSPLSGQEWSIRPSFTASLHNCLVLQLRNSLTCTDTVVNKLGKGDFFLILKTWCLPFSFLFFHFSSFFCHFSLFHSSISVKILPYYFKNKKNILMEDNSLALPYSFGQSLRCHLWFSEGNAIDCSPALRSENHERKS